jgi:hypothetical protein
MNFFAVAAWSERPCLKPTGIVALRTISITKKALPIAKIGVATLF